MLQEPLEIGVRVNLSACHRAFLSLCLRGSQLNIEVDITNGPAKPLQVSFSPEAEPDWSLFKQRSKSWTTIDLEARLGLWVRRDVLIKSKIDGIKRDLPFA